MESRLVIFLAFASVTLIANTLAIWFAYRALANMSSKVTESMREFSTSSTTQSWIESLEIASTQAAGVSAVVKEQIQNFDPVLARAQDVYGYGLAKIDAKFENVCDVVSRQVENAQAAIIRPAEKIGAVASGLQTVLGLAPRE